MNGDVLRSIAAADVASTLNAFRREILAALVLAAFGLFFYRFVYTAGAEELAAAKNRSAAIAAETERIAAEVAAVEGLRRQVLEAESRLAVLEGRLESLRERLPTEKNISEILSEFSSGTNGGSAIVSVKPLDPEVKGELTRLPFHLKMETTFLGFGEYLEGIEKMARIMVVDNFMIEAGEGAGPGRLSSQIFLSAYILGGDDR